MQKGRINKPNQSKYLLPVLGKIKVGEKTEKGYPRSLDYFKCDSKYADLFLGVYGEKPSTIQVAFISDDFLRSCSERYEYRDDSGGLVAEGDGETFRVWSSKTLRYETFSILDYPSLMEGIQNKNPTKLSVRSGNGWTVILTITFIMPTIKGVAGLWQFETKGNSSTIPQIRDTFDLVLEKTGSVVGKLFDLSVKMAKSQKPGITSKYPVVSLVPNESDENLNRIKQNNFLKLNENNGTR